jgi:hypothetical protein
MPPDSTAVGNTSEAAQSEARLSTTNSVITYGVGPLAISLDQHGVPQAF